jgi:hypothetical protein
MTNLTRSAINVDALSVAVVMYDMSFCCGDTRSTNCTINLRASSAFCVRAIVNVTSINCHLLLADVLLVVVVVSRLSAA